LIILSLCVPAKYAYASPHREERDSNLTPCFPLSTFVERGIKGGEVKTALLSVKIEIKNIAC
jgi:hypothetical protein